MLKCKKPTTAEKKRHTGKNNLVVTDHQLILYLSPTYEGSTHDQGISNQEQMQFPVGTTVRVDTGFRGFVSEGSQVIKPYVNPYRSRKNPKKKTHLTTEQQQYNTALARKRVVVEHC